MKYNVYNLGQIVNGGFEEYNLAIVNGSKVILTDNEAVHTIYNFLDAKPFSYSDLTIQDVLNAKPIGEIEQVGNWVRSFGNRIETNYNILLKSIKSIGLNPKDFPRDCN